MSTCAPRCTSWGNGVGGSHNPSSRQRLLQQRGLASCLGCCMAGWEYLCRCRPARSYKVVVASTSEGVCFFCVCGLLCFLFFALFPNWSRPCVKVHILIQWAREPAEAGAVSLIASMWGRDRVHVTFELNAMPTLAGKWGEELRTGGLWMFPVVFCLSFSSLAVA